MNVVLWKGTCNRGLTFCRRIRVSNKEQQGIDKIQCGRIDFYIPLMFETKFSFADICHKINNGLDKDITKHYSTIQQDFLDLHAEIEDELNIEQYGKITLSQRVKKIIRDKRKINRGTISRENMNNVIMVGETDKGIKIELALEELETYHDNRRELISKYDKYKEIYGSKFTNSQDIYVLLPLHIQLNNGEYVWLNVILFVFRNKMGILKLELPLTNVSSQPLMEYKYDEFIKSIEIPWLINMPIQESTIEGIREAYKKKFIEDYGICVRQIGDSFRNILLSDFDGIPKRIGSIPNKVMVDLYRIIAAPVTIMDCTSYEKEAKDYIEEHQWAKHNSKYICSTTGGCLSITDIAFRDYFLGMYKQEYGIDESDEQEKRIIYEKVVNNLCLNVEYAIIIMILKHMTTECFYELLVKKPQEMHMVKKEYNVNVMYISELQESCFGTVSEQIETFERVMPYYLKENITADKLKAVDCILAEEEAKKQASLQNVIGFGGLIMAALFGLPAIYETFSILRQVCTFISIDIPAFTIENFSVFVWLALLCIFICVLSVWKVKNRRKF